MERKGGRKGGKEGVIFSSVLVLEAGHTVHTHPYR